MKHYEVVAAILVNTDQEIFCAKRKDDGELGLKWEFPGGKIELGESHQDALIREIKEELAVDITVDRHVQTVHHQYKTFQLTMHAYWAKISAGHIQLCEHLEAKWLPKTALKALDWAAADLPIVKTLSTSSSLEDNPASS